MLKNKPIGEIVEKGEKDFVRNQKVREKDPWGQNFPKIMGIPNGHLISIRYFGL